MINVSSYRVQQSLLFVLATVSLFPGIGLAPLFLEEPRRALVAMEMAYNHDYIHTTIHGQPYYNKPPLFNWIILVGYKIFGYHEWILRLITVTSHLLIGWLVLKIGKKYYSAQAGLLAAGLYLAGADILFYFSLIGEIDVFFSLLIVSGWFFYFHFEQKQKLRSAYLLFYLFMALGFLTKGLPAVLFAAFTMAAWHLYNNQFKRLFSLEHLLGVGLSLIILSLYFYPFISAGDFNTLLSTLWGQSIERAEAPDISKRLISLIKFPVLLLKDIMPAAFILMLFRISSFKNYLKLNPLFAFCFITFISNIWVYWISPDSQSRYHYMFHPLLILMLIYIYTGFDPKSRPFIWLQKIFTGLNWIFLVVLIAGVAAVPMLLPTKGVAWMIPVAIPLAVMVFFWEKRALWPAVFSTVLLMLIVRLPYGYITHQERSQHSQASKDKKVGIEMAETVGNAPVYLWDSTRISTTISYYLQLKLNRIVPYSSEMGKGAYFIMADSVIQPGLSIEKTFTYQGNPYSLVLKK